MAAELEAITSPGLLTEKVLAIRENKESSVLLSEIGGGVLRFTEAVFPDVDIDKVFVQKNDREPEGRGAHFDVYHQIINKDFPWITLYNLSGFATMTILDLPEDLATSYFTRYPDPTDAAFEARGLFSEIALQVPGVDPVQGKIKPGTGIVLSQGAQGPHIIHDIVPADPQDSGKYLKFVVPSSSNEAKKRMKEGGYEPLDEFITRGIGGTLTREEDAVVTTTPGAPEARLSSKDPLGIGARRSPRGHSRPGGHRPCKMD